MSARKDTKIGAGDSSPYPELDALSINELAEEMSKLAAVYADLDQQAATIYLKWDAIRKLHIPAKMDELGIESIKIKDIGTVGFRSDAWCTTLDALGLAKWLRTNKHKELIKESVNASSLKSFLKELIKEGKTLPPEEIVKFTPYSYVSITGAPPK